MKKITKSSMLKKNYKEIFNRYKTLKKIFKKKKLVFFDVGSNTGQTINEVEKHFPNSEIHSFEPQKECINNLLKLKKKKRNINLNFYALGDKKQKKIFYKNKNNVLSGFHKVNILSKSFIKMKKLRKNDKYLKTINTPEYIFQNTLDNYMKLKKIKKIDILKIDTQGYEENVLKGINKKNMKKISSIVIEINLWDFYVKKNSFFIIEKYLNKNFDLWDISAIFKNPKYKNTDHLDAIYVNKNFIKNIVI